jgi:hypothetical protein
VSLKETEELIDITRLWALRTTFDSAPWYVAKAKRKMMIGRKDTN